MANRPQPSGKKRYGPSSNGSATTTKVVLRAIQHIRKSRKGLARRHGVNRKTVAKKRKRLLTTNLRTEPKEAKSTTLPVEDEAALAAFPRHTRCLDYCQYALQAAIRI